MKPLLCAGLLKPSGSGEARVWGLLLPFWMADSRWPGGLTCLSPSCWASYCRGLCHAELPGSLPFAWPYFHLQSFPLSVPQCCSGPPLRHTPVFQSCFPCHQNPSAWTEPVPASQHLMLLPGSYQVLSDLSSSPVSGTPAPPSALDYNPLPLLLPPQGSTQQPHCRLSASGKVDWP